MHRSRTTTSVIFLGSTGRWKRWVKSWIDFGLPVSWICRYLETQPACDAWESNGESRCPLSMYEHWKIRATAWSRHWFLFQRAHQIRETPHKRHHKFIEFYDVRAAEAALRSLNRSDIAGKRIKLEPSRPGGARRRLVPWSPVALLLILFCFDRGFGLCTVVPWHF